MKLTIFLEENVFRARIILFIVMAVPAENIWIQMGYVNNVWLHVLLVRGSLYVIIAYQDIT